MRQFFRWAITVIFFGAVVLAGSSAEAQKRKLNAEVRSLLTRARTGSPMPFEWKLTWEGQGLLEGQLVYTVYDDDKVLARFRSDDLALAVGEQRFSAVLPAITFSGSLSQATLQTEFVGKDKTLSLRENILLVPAREQRTLTLGFVGGPTSPTRDEQQLVDGLRFETFRPDESLASVVTVVTYFSPSEVFSDPLMYCGFDLLALSGNGFSGLSEKQLEALLKWIDAGGSACVVPGGNLAQRHVTFLNALSETDANRATFVADASGRVVIGTIAAAASPRLFRRGLGRAAVFLPEASQSSTNIGSALREVAAHLWKARPKQTAAMTDTGKWVVPPAPKPDSDNWRLYRYEAFSPRSSLEVMKFPAMNGLIGAIKPRNVEVVPVSVIGVTLLLYVLAIGPLDYFLLGKLKLRRLTWVVFPVVTLGFTVFAIALSHSYLGSNDTRRALEILDVAEKGRVVRTSRYEMLFSSLARTVESDVRQALFTPLSLEPNDELVNMSNMSAGNLSSGLREMSRHIEPPEYVGRVPSRHVVRQPVKQWTPQINRLFSIAPEMPDDAAHLRFDWDEPMGDLSGAGWQSLVNRVHEAFGAEASVCLLAGTECHTLADPKQLAASLARQAGIRNYPEDNDNHTNFLKDSCSADHSGLFAIVSHISPTGGDNFEDLPVLDVTDPRQKLLVILVEHEGTLRMYRKLYFGDR